VATAADGQLQPRVTRQRDDVGDLVGVGGLDDDGWVAVDAAVEDGARLVVVGIPRRDHPAVEGGAQLPDRHGGSWAGGRGLHEELLGR
jgi:hypothetical protein